MVFFKKNTKVVKKGIGFDDLSSGEKKKIIKYAIKKSNEEQMELIKKYEKIYGKE